MSFCCAGCEGVYKLLKSERLGRYYDILNDIRSHGPSQSQVFQPRYSVNNELVDVDPSQYRQGVDGTSYAIFFPEFTCAACIWLVEKTIVSIDGISAFQMNLEERLLILTIPENAGTVLSHVLSKMAGFGYHGFPCNALSQDQVGKVYSRELLIQVGIAGAIFANVMLFSSSVYLTELFDGFPQFTAYFNLFSFVLATVSMATSGRSLFQNAWRSCKARVLHIDLPIVVALSMAWILSVYHLIRGSGGVYFDSVSGLIFFLLVGRYLSESLTSRARQFMGAAAHVIPRTSLAIAVGDEVVVDQGGVVPADGVITSGSTEISEAFLTGESLPIVKTIGSKVYGGTMNLGSLFKMKVTASGTATWLARLDDLVSKTSGQRGQNEQLSQMIASWFIFGTFVVSLCGFGFWLESGFTQAMEVVCSILIVSCPCALAMAIPLANALAVKQCWTKGTVIRNVRAFEQARHVDTVIFDKTGTLTTGDMRVVDVKAFEGHSPFPVEYLHQMTRGCMHPVARAVHIWSEHHAPSDFVVVNQLSYPGQGMMFQGEIQFPESKKSCEVYLGSLAWIATKSESDGVKSFFSRVNNDGSANSLCALLWKWGEASETSEHGMVFYLRDQMRGDASEVISHLREMGLKLRLLSGDRMAVAREVGIKLGFEEQEIFAEHLPEQKMAFVSGLAGAGHKVMMVGDGVNDAAVMKRAAIGVGVFGGTDMTLQAADVFFTRKDLQGVPHLIEYSAYHFNSVRAILGVSLGYNLIAIGLALTNHIHPFTAALIMPMASLTVLLVAWLRKGRGLWKFSTLSCPLP